MSYIYPIDAQAMFDDRADQFVGFGVPPANVAEMRNAVTEMWTNAPGGWVFEWSRLAARYAGDGEHYLASLAYGCAKFPCLANSARADALAAQVKEYVAAAATFPVRFERRALAVPYRGGSITVPVHLFTASDAVSKSAVLLLSGGVDTWKMDVHSLLLAFAQRAGVTVLAFDQPGTGETPVPLNADADELILGLVGYAKSLGNGHVGHMGVSFGANFSAMTGLSGAVDAAIVLGGPIEGAFVSERLAKLPYGMADIVGNAIGFDHQPTIEALTAAAAGLSRHALLQRPSNAPMLVINGADDYFVPQADTLVFDGRSETEVHLIPGTGHAAMSKLTEVLPLMVGWLRARIGQS